MTASMLYRSLGELLDRSRPLPDLVNVYVTVEDSPLEKSDFGGRWHVRVSGLDRTGEAKLAVHRQPTLAAVSLPYTTTSPELLELFDNEPFRRLFQSGESALVQAVPRRGSDLILYLNVQAVLLLRPFQAFGRRQIDFSSGCARKSYLAVAKAARGIRLRGDLNWGSVGGFVAEDVFLYLSQFGDRPAGVAPDHLLSNALTPLTIAVLVMLHFAKGPTEVQSALGKGRDTLRSVAASPALQAILRSGPWEHGSDALNNGVTVAPDLLGPKQKQVADLKHHAPGTANVDAPIEQVESYLAWAMVEFGVEEVLAQWVGQVVNLHSGVDSSRQVIAVAPDLTMLGRRIRNRHRLLALSSGAWLPVSLFDECHRCMFARPPEAEPDLPPACEFYCQTERHWSCVSADGRPCKLLDLCDQHDRFFAHDRLDQFNRLRQLLLDEEEEQAAVEGLVAGLGAPMLSLEEFVVRDVSPGHVRLTIPYALRKFVLGCRGEPFVVTLAGRPREVVRMRRQRDDEIVLTSANRLPSLPLGATVALRHDVAAHFPVRDQLAQLDQLQRRGEEPIALRSGTRTVPLRVHEHTALPPSSLSARLVLVDAPGMSGVREAARKLLQSGLPGRRVLLICAGPLQSGELGISAVEVSPLSLSELFTAEVGDTKTRLTNITRRLQVAMIWEASAEDLVGGLLDPLAGEPTFDDVVVLNAEALHLLALLRCLKLARGRVLFVGQALAAGPRAESAAARQSLLFQNPLRLLLEAAEAVLPDDVTEVEVIRLPVPRAAGDAKRLGLLGRVAQQVPIVWHESPTPSVSNRGGELQVVGTVARTPGQARVTRARLRLLDRSSVSLRQLRLVLRRLQARAIESLRTPPHVDTTVLGYRAKVEEVQTSLIGSEHEITVVFSLADSPWVQEYGLTNILEAEALVQFARDQNTPCVAVSPFQAQCRLIAALGADLPHLRVYSPETLGVRPISGPMILLLSTVAGGAEPDFPYPLNDPGKLAPLLVGPYACIHLFAAAGVAEHHPLFRGATVRCQASEAIMGPGGFHSQSDSHPTDSRPEL